MPRRCRRCGDSFETRSADQTHCTKCAIEVAALIVSDDRRRRPRFRAKDFTGSVPL